MNEKIILPELIDLFCEKQGMNRKDAELFVKGMLDLIEEALTNEKYVKVKGLGTFKLTEVDSRESVNINTGERIEILGHTKVSFTPDTVMKELINKPFAHFETVVLNDGVEFEDTPVEVPETLDTQEAIAPAIETPAEVETPVQEETPEIFVLKEEPTEEIIVPETIVTEEFEIAEGQEVTEDPEAIEEPETTEEPQLEIVEETPISEEIPIQEEAPLEEPQPTITEVAEEEKPESIEEKPSEEEVMETIVEEKVVEESKEKSINRILWGVIVVLVLIILFGAYWMFLRPSDTTEVPVVTPEVQEEIASSTEDTTQTVTFYDSEPPIYMQPLKLTAEELRKERVPALADTLEYLINGKEPICEHTLKSGETIIRISVEYYGSKRFWPYIAKFNSDEISNPDNIPIGTIIKIPAIVPKE